MAGYDAVARLDRADIRLGGTARPFLDHPDPHLAPKAEVEDLSGRPFGEPFRDWWETVREQFAMTTFYLFDPESWR